MDRQASYLLVIGEREALAWILRERRMAFPETRRAEVDRLGVGDDLLILTTRGCFHNPSRDRTRVVGTAMVTTSVAPLDSPVAIAGRTFPRGCHLDINALTPYLTGVDLADLIPALESFPDKANWSIRLRRPLVALTEHDAELLHSELKGTAQEPPDSAIRGYLERIRPIGASRPPFGR
jgi:hypothetical protein